MKITENLLLLRYCSALFFFLVIFPQTCCCINPPHKSCSPSSCGNIHNISYPFRLKHDPKHCGYPQFELECQNNATTILNLKSQRYKVKAINYANQTIWLADISMKNTTCSFPNVSLNGYFLSDSPYSLYTRDKNKLYTINWPISLMSCPYPLKNSSLIFTELPTHCSSNPSTHAYIKVYMIASDVRDNCTMELTVLTSWNFTDWENISSSEFHDSLLYGFQLYWGSEWSKRCRQCYGRQKCARNEHETVSCRQGLGEMLQGLWVHIKSHDGHYYISSGYSMSPPTSAVILILLLILVVVFAGVSLPAKIVVGFTCAAAFTYVEFNAQIFNIYWPIIHFRLVIGLFFAVRFILIFPCIIWFFIFKIRRGRLSRFAAIEDFLQSENNFMPMRYTYSDIKKMTRGFREKLGQGGYGTVYKGKLRSGYNVAVKLLEKSGGNGQDFMNEIATVGRIHHVNVVKLVGFCAERSKRALVFYYMSNGSLDKYLYSQEKATCLSWEKKYDIAIGVARGIEYLHRGCDIQILHFDIKPHNILLDDNFTPKITDFGLAKIFSTDKTVVTMTAIRGTIGYVAPELINRGFGGVSYKADVYSFGMLLIEMVGLNKDFRKNNKASSQYFPDWIYDCFEQGHDIDIGDVDESNDDDNNDSNVKIAKKMAIVALWCIQMSPANRPSMNKVVEMLEAQVESLRVPNRPSQSNQVAGNNEDQSWTFSTNSTSLLPCDSTSIMEITVED